MFVTKVKHGDTKHLLLETARKQGGQSTRCLLYCCINCVIKSEDLQALVYMCISKYDMQECITAVTNSRYSLIQTVRILE